MDRNKEAHRKRRKQKVGEKKNEKEIVDRGDMEKRTKKKKGKSTQDN